MDNCILIMLCYIIITLTNLIKMETLINNIKYAYIHMRIQNRVKLQTSLVYSEHTSTEHFTELTYIHSLL